MSYPNQNPYGPPPGQQPGYGHPQQQPPSPYGPYPGGGPMPGMQPQFPTVMPGGLKAARTMLFVLAGLNVIGLVIAVAGLGSVSKAAHNTSPYDSNDTATVLSFGKGVLIAVIVLIVIFSAVAITLALQFGNGGKGVRSGAIAFGIANTLVSLLSFPFGLIHTVLGVLIIAFTAKDESNAWFNRPRY